MTDAPAPQDHSAVLERLQGAMNRHDLAALVACFHEDYDSQQPVHPDRAFRGRAQVERNWGSMFAGLPDFHADLLRSAVAGEEVWAEWHWTGTRADGSRLDVRGMTVFGVRGGRIAWARLYVEDTDEAGRGIDAAVRSLAAGADRASERTREPRTGGDTT